jgi:Ca2+-binding EF-hand superfamily protein
VEEFKKLIRRTLRISKEELSDKDMVRLISLLDGDGGGELDIEELALFVEKGAEAFVKRNAAGKDKVFVL